MVQLVANQLEYSPLFWILAQRSRWAPWLSIACLGNVQFPAQPIVVCEWIAESTLSVQKYTLVAVSPAQKPLRLIPEAGQLPLVCVLHAHVGGRGSCLCPGSIFLSRRKNAWCSAGRQGPLLLQMCLPQNYHCSVGRSAWTLGMVPKWKWSWAEWQESLLVSLRSPLWPQAKLLTSLVLSLDGGIGRVTPGENDYEWMKHVPQVTEGIT